VATGFIELNDAGISHSIGGKTIGTSMAYAVLENDQLLIGEQARQKARLFPSWTNNRFWNQLNTDPIANATHAIRHHADLAFAHLEHIWQNMAQDVDQLVLAVPGYYDQQQLGLLLGMAKESKIPVVGLVDTALISVAEQACQQSTLYLDISLHRITLTRLRSASSLDKLDTQTVTETGLFTLWDRWATIVAKQFIQTSRYDPMHQAESEQILFNLLPNWIAQSNGKSTQQFDIELESVTHSAPIPDDQLLSACDSIYTKVIQTIEATIAKDLNQGKITSLFVSHRFKGFPGFSTNLGRIPGLELHFLNSSTAQDSAQTYWHNLLSDSGAVSYVTSLPITNTFSESVSHTQAPSHFLSNHRAYKLGQAMHIASLDAHDSPHFVKNMSDAAFTLNVRGQKIRLQVHSANVQLNNQSIKSNVDLKIGDQIKYMGQVVSMIAVN